MSNSITTA